MDQPIIPPPRLKLTDLPTEILLKILSNLSMFDIATKVSLLSKKFRGLCLDSSLWKEMKLSQKAKLNSIRTMNVLERCSQLERLHISQITSGWIDAHLLGIAALKNCPKLVMLELRNLNFVMLEWHISVLIDLLEAIRDNGLNLCTLVLFFPSSKKSDILAYNANCLKRITTLRLPHLIEAAMVAIADNCKDLQHFQATVWGIKDETLNYFLKKVHKTLRSLGLKRIGWNGISFRNLGLCHALEQFYTPSAKGLRVEALGSITKVSRLISLKLTGALMLENYDFVHVFSRRKFDHLTMMDLSNCWKLEDDGLTVMAKACPNLEYLDLTCCFRVTDFGSILCKCISLKTLILAYTKVSGDSFKNNPNKLTELILYCCQQMTDEGLAVMVANCPNLVRVNVEYCDRVTKEGIKKYFSNQTVNKCSPRNTWWNEISLQFC